MKNDYKIKKINFHITKVLAELLNIQVDFKEDLIKKLNKKHI